MDTVIVKSETPDEKGDYTVHIVYYLSKEDPNYEKSLIYDVDRTSKEWLDGCSIKITNDSTQEEIDAYNKWYDSLPRIWTPQVVNRHYNIISQHIDEVSLKAITDKRKEEAETAKSVAVWL